MHKITIADASTLGEGVSFDSLAELGELRVFSSTLPEEAEAHLAEAEVLIANKVKLPGSLLSRLPNCRLICLAATGYDNVDVAYCREHGIAVCNVVGYSSSNVAQITVGMVLSLVSHLPEYTAYVNSGAYGAEGVANHLSPLYHEIDGLQWGIVGYGNIGKRVAKAAEALGCRVVYTRRHPQGDTGEVDLETLCRTSDIISLHTPLNDSTTGLIGREQLLKMKDGVILVNAARGAVLDEGAVADAVLSGKISGFGCDVYSVEPFGTAHPYQKLLGLPQVMLTPHMMWGSLEARRRCLAEIQKNIDAFFRGDNRCRVD